MADFQGQIRWISFHNIKKVDQNIRSPFRAPNFNFVVTEIWILNQTNPYHNAQPCIFKTHFNVMFPSTSRSYGWWRILKIADLHLVWIFPVTDISCMHPSTTLSWSQFSFIMHIPSGRHTQADLTRPDQTIKRIEKHVQSTWIKPIQLKPVWCIFSLNMDVHWTALLATALWRWRRYEKWRLSLNPIQVWTSDLSDMPHLYSVSVYIVDNPQLVINFIIKLWRLRHNRRFRRLYCLHLQELTVFLYLWSRWCHWNFLLT